MLIDIKPRLTEPNIRDLLSYAVFPDPDRLKEVVDAYRRDPEMELYGYEAEGEIISLLGGRYDSSNHCEILHLAVRPEERGKGYGRGIILEFLARKKPKALTAETDEEAVEFYRRLGFVITGLGQKFPGTERFRCFYDATEGERGTGGDAQD